MPDHFLAIWLRWVLKTRLQIQPDKATGPDYIPGRFLKQVATSIAKPLTQLLRRITNEHHWPQIWRTHWIHPLYKKGSSADPKNYRGIHLTCILSKVAERVIGKLFLPYLDNRQ